MVVCVTTTVVFRVVWVRVVASCTKLLTHAADYFDLACTQTVVSGVVCMCEEALRVCVCARITVLREVSKSTVARTTTTTTKQQ